MTSPLRALWSALAALALAGPVVLGAATASAAPRQAIEYDALGDSYASGYGVGPYEGGACARSQSAYSVQIDGRMKINLDDFVACAGATTTTLVSRGQLNALDADTDLVTLTIGGNDIGWSSTVGACLLGSDAQCAGARAITANVVQTVLPGLLDAVYSQVAAAAPNAHVVVTGYPPLFSPEYGAYYGASPAEQQALNEGAALLNSVIAQVAAEHGFQFVDVTKRFEDHGVNAPEPWIFGLTDPGRFHPNALGYEAYAAAVTAAIKPSQLK
ncbi:SGNH/GDSL hydrolase family protein [Nocardioides mesophilus]|uniref:SGNH/GDSL hydrolase family protein n=1 Tax=Nocardioides mesophilus TaxID=433659 RepID=A0A7G9REG2_9ACTN|nr:SGNH/GDSL hydrolase family protein [Nocardioides mesophilus]QNN53987.1 SGNH/GDSL hydrolase family protein [Nocardioides mesophilus]